MSRTKLLIKSMAYSNKTVPVEYETVSRKHQLLPGVEKSTQKNPYCGVEVGEGEIRNPEGRVGGGNRGEGVQKSTWYLVHPLLHP